jgi:hypothetical protein
MTETPENPAFWEATDERGLIFYQGGSVIRIPKDKLPNLMLDAAKLLSRKDGQ